MPLPWISEPRRHIDELRRRTDELRRRTDELQRRTDEARTVAGKLHPAGIMSHPYVDELHRGPE